MPVFRDERSEEYPHFSKRVIESYRKTGIDRVMDQMNLLYGIDPDWLELFNQFIRGDLYSRPLFSQALREICACAALACMDKQNLLRTHLLNGAAHGAPKEELLEAILQSVVFGGFPAAITSIKTFAEVFPDMVKRDRPPLPASDRQSHPDMQQENASAQGLAEEYNFSRWDPGFAKSVQRLVIDGLNRRTIIDGKKRHLIALACLTVKNALPQIETYIQTSFRAGLQREEIQEVIFQMSAYAGFPYVSQALQVLERVIEGRDRK